ncbi:hypothetical protein [Acidovorax sp. A1169]|uniref:hypothetical protein n=1 Tax=Acidovorax sp. A1169 TaxID=3059524 RepID=UPI002737E854|nr:hypothetical protein [Acidovorax sp. A1169]MDP4078260.1 hypothetical protein [Acidovorax sp. A1169]
MNEAKNNAGLARGAESMKSHHATQRLMAGMLLFQTLGAGAMQTVARAFGVTPTRRWTWLTLGVWATLPALSLLPLWSNLLNPVLPDAHEHVRYAVLSSHFQEAMAAGIWYPRWLPDFNAGYGYPEFVFYQPGYFFLNSWLAVLTDDLLWRQLLTLGALCLIGGLGVYRLARTFVDRLSALALVVLFQAAPYVHINLYERGDLSEWMVIQLLPWVLHWSWCLLAPVQRSTMGMGGRALCWSGLTLVLAASFYSHPMAVLFLPLVVALLGMLTLAGTEHQAPLAVRLRSVLELAGALLLALALASPYWLPVAQLKPLVNAQVALTGGFEAWRNVASLSGVLFDPQAFLAAPFVALALSGAWQGRGHPFIRAAGLVYLVLFLAMLPTGRWFWHLYPFSLMQFPWRLAVFAPALQVVCTLGYWHGSNRHSVLRRLGLTLGLLALTWSAWNYHDFRALQVLGEPVAGAQLDCVKTYPSLARPNMALATLDGGEWLPARFAKNPPETARYTPISQTCEAQLARHRAALTGHLGVDQFSNRSTLNWMTSDSAHWQGHPQPGHSPHALNYRFAGANPGVVVIQQIYLPGWSVHVNGLALTATTIEEQLLPDGRMQVRLAAGEHTITARYDGPPGAKQRNVAIGLALLLAAAYWLRRLRKQGGLKFEVGY